ncbi:MAG: geranylgeranyl reductase family protein, partial [archaeon]|nr:geranylgeranyl reductase family protein [archaeon]
MALVNVVGAGPVGLRCATLLAKEGFETEVLEEHSTVGRPVQCAGLVSKEGISALNLGLEEQDFVLNKVFGAKIFSPHGTVLEVRKKKPVAMVIDRFKFDQLLYKQALKANVSVKLNSKLIDFRNGNLFLEAQGHGELKKCKIVVGADGPNSIIRHSIYPKIGGESFVHALQYRIEGSFDEKMVEVHFGSYAKGFFAWVIPESSSVARIGLGAKLGRDVEKHLKIFLDEKKIEGKVLSKSSALIPIREPLKNAVENNALLLGDAGFHTKATTGGGIVMGLEAAAVAAETVANHLKHHSSLVQYNKNLSQVNRELSIHWKIYSYINSLKGDDLDKLFLKAKNAGIEQFLEEH